jgi:hypothetical protein
MADDIYDYAAQTGLIPPVMVDPNMKAGFAPVEQEPVPRAPVMTGQPGFGGVPMEALQGVDPRAIPQMPRGVPPSDLPPDLAGRSQSARVSQSYSGTSEAKKASLEKGDTRYAAQMANADDQALSEMQPALDAQGVARDASKAAEIGVAEANARHIEAEGRAAQALSDAQAGFAQEDMRAHAEATANEDLAKADYIAALADFRAQKINPAGYWDDQSTGGKIGMVAAAFAHDFLGAQGIKTSAGATLAAAIDRNIDVQARNIQLKGDALPGFKQLWEMQRAQSQSDLEARTRVKGFLLESMKQAITANMAQYQSGLATAQGQKALAEVEKLYAKNISDVYQQISQNTASLRQNITSRMNALTSAAAQNYATSVQKSLGQQRIDLDKAKQAAEAQASRPLTVADPGDNMNKYVFKVGVLDAQKMKVMDKFAQAAGVAESIEDLRSMARDPAYTVLDGHGVRRWSDPGKRAYASKVERLKHEWAAAIDGRPTDKDVQQLGLGLPTPTELSSKVDRILATSKRDIIAPLRHMSDQFLETLPEDQWTPANRISPMAAQELEAKASQAAGADEPAKTPISKASATITQPDSFEYAAPNVKDAAQNDGATPNQDWKSFQDKKFEGSDDILDKVLASRKGDDEKVPAYAVALSRLKVDALNNPGGEAEAMLRAYTGAGEGGVPSFALPDGTDPNSPKGQQIREFAQHELELLYELYRTSEK